MFVCLFFSSLSTPDQITSSILPFVCWVPVSVQFSKPLVYCSGSVSCMLHSRLGLGCGQWFILEFSFQSPCCICFGSVLYMYILSIFPWDSYHNLGNPLLELSLRFLPHAQPWAHFPCPLAVHVEFLLGFCMSLLPWLLLFHYQGHFGDRAVRGKEKKKIRISFCCSCFLLRFCWGLTLWLLLGGKIGKNLNRKLTFT